MELIVVTDLRYFLDLISSNWLGDSNKDLQTVSAEVAHNNGYPLSQYKTSAIPW